MNHEPIDWEAEMTRARESAEQAAKNSDRSLGGIAEVAHRQKSQVSTLAAFGKIQGEIANRLSSLEEAQREIGGAIVRTRSAPAAPTPRLWLVLLLSSGVSALVASVVSGANW